VVEALVTGVAVIGVAEALATGVVAIGAAVIGTAIGVITVTITDPLVLSSLAASAFHRGGAGAIRTDTMAMATRTITMATAMATTATDMITISPVTGTAIAANQGLQNCSGDSPAPAIIVALSTGSWDHRRGEQFELTSATTET
jgi:hypothetical protein